MTPTRSDNLFILAFVILAISVLSPRIVFAQQKLGYAPGTGFLHQELAVLPRRRWQGRRT